MSRFEKLGVWILVAAAILLPLYELSDYTEVWPDDGNVILTAVAFLFGGMALVSGAFFRKALTVLVTAFAGCNRVLIPSVLMNQSRRVRHERAPPDDLPLTFRDLRI
jgi:hypothetical protein